MYLRLFVSYRSKVQDTADKFVILDLPESLGERKSERKRLIKVKLTTSPQTTWPIDVHSLSPRGTVTEHTSSLPRRGDSGLVFSFLEPMFCSHVVYTSTTPTSRDTRKLWTIPYVSLVNSYNLNHTLNCLM